VARKFRTKEWAVLLFIANDNDLDAFTNRKIEEIATVGSTIAADVVIQFDTRGASPIRRMRLSKGRQFPLRKLQGETNTGDKRTLIRFIDLTLEDFHPRRTMVVISNHGSGFAIAGDESIVRGTRSPIFRTFDLREKGLVAPDSGRLVDAHPDALDLLELKAALMSIVRKHGRLELVAFDACLMSTFEVAYQLRRATRWMVGSQSNIPVPGCLFASTLTLMRDENIPTPDIAKAVVENVTPVMFDQYSAMAALDLDKADDLAETISVLADALTRHLTDEGAFEAISTAHLSSLAFLDSETIDLFDFCEKLFHLVDDEDVREAASDVQEAIEQQFVLHKKPHGAVVQGARGVSILLPRSKEIPETYRQLDFARETSWIDFLDAYLQQRFAPIAEQPPGSSEGVRFADSPL